MLKYVLCLSAGLLMFNALVVANDYVNDEAAKKGAVREAGRIYEAVSGKKPTLDNLLKSLEEPTEKTYKDNEDIIKLKSGEYLIKIKPTAKSEARGALRVLLLMEPKTNEIAEKVLKCSEAYKDEIGIRLHCGEYLIKVESKRNQGIEILRSLIRDPKADLGYKLLAASSLTEVGILDGYSLVREGLMAKEIADKRLATYLLKKFIPYNGKPYNEKGDKINIEEIVISFKDKVGPETSAELSSIQQMLHQKSKDQK